MRLVCPNCGAQYEVDDRVIPEGGRDVQCSNCGHAWFQRDARSQVTESDQDPDNLQGDPQTLPDETPSPLPDNDAAPDDQGDQEETAPAAAALAERPRRPLDENVRDILAEEAEREMQARAREAGTVETQAELGIDDYAETEEERERQARERMARMRGIEEGEALVPEVAPPEPAPPGPRRDLFPDIDEINSTLDSPAGAATPPGRSARFEAETADAPKRSGFSRGFSLVVILVGLAFVVYLMAPRIVGAVPALTDAMVAYVDMVNGVLGWIEGLMQQAVDKIEAAADSQG